jgi:membrane-bound lytic murein transglycosylase B
MMSLLVPQGARGPAFLVTKNFRVILRYNFATSYALAVLHLADRLSGGTPIAKAWPTVTALTRTQRMALQKELAERGHDTGGIDGILGNKSVVAIRAEQRKLGIAEDGFADFELLNRLQEDAEPVTGATQ